MRADDLASVLEEEAFQPIASCHVVHVTARRYQDMLERRIPAVAFRRVVRSQERRDAGKGVMLALASLNQQHVLNALYLVGF